jgi:hypothetical protein
MSAFGGSARQLLPGSAVMRRLGTRAPKGPRWVAYYSNLDLLIQPAASAKLDGAENHLVKDHGHVSLLLSPGVARSVTAVLDEQSTAAEPAAKAAPGRAA